jgi:fructose-1-phosphate kinase PfkB-like protein
MLWDVFPDKVVSGGTPMNVTIGLKKLMSGDAFLAGIIHNYLKNKPLKETLEFACRRGTYMASREGANPPFLKTELDNFKDLNASTR